MAEFSINNPNGYLAGPLGSFRVYGADGRLKAIGAGGGGGATWGTITGNILNQTDLINYISSQVGSGFVPETRTLTINGVTYDLTADRTWTIPAGGTVTDVTGTGTVSGLTLTGSGTTSVTLTLGGSLVLVASDITTALGYTPLSQATADTLYYPLTANPSNYVTSSALTTILSNYLTTAAAASTYLTITNAAITYQPIFTTQNGLTYGGGLLELGGPLVKNTSFDGQGFNWNIYNLNEYDSSSNSFTYHESLSTTCTPPIYYEQFWSGVQGVTTTVGDYIVSFRNTRPPYLSCSIYNDLVAAGDEITIVDNVNNIINVGNVTGVITPCTATDTELSFTVTGTGPGSTLFTPVYAYWVSPVPAPVQHVVNLGYYPINGPVCPAVNYVNCLGGNIAINRCIPFLTDELKSYMVGNTVDVYDSSDVYLDSFLVLSFDSSFLYVSGGDCNIDTANLACTIKFTPQVLGTGKKAYTLLDNAGAHPQANSLPTASVILENCTTGKELGVKAVDDSGTDKLLVLTNDHTNKTVGDVLTLVDPATGEVEFQTPTGGGGGIAFAVASGTDTYTATVTGVTGYADGDAYIIRFTNGNTDAATLNINSLGAIPLHQNNQVPLIGGDIWDGGEMLCIYNAPDNSFECVGTSPNSLFAYVTNVNGSTISRGQAVVAFGGTGNRITVKLAQANNDANSAQTLGFVFSTSIADNQKGIIIIQGYFTGLSLFPTATWNDGDPVYLSPTTPGAVTKTKPYAPNHLVYLGVVASASNGSAGRMYVRVQNGYELDELHNVQAQSPSLKDTLWYDNTVTPGQWKTASIATILGYTPGTVSSVSGTGSVAGITLSGTVTTSGNLTLGGTLAVPIANITATGTPSATTFLRGDGSWATPAGGGGAATIGVTIDGSGGVITPGQKGYVQVPYACTINSWRIIANAAGSIVIDVWKTAAPTIPTVANTITGSALPTLSSQQTAASSTLTGWTTSVAANDIIGFNVNSANTVSWVILQLIVTKI